MTRKKKLFLGFLLLPVLAVIGMELAGSSVRWFHLDANYQRRGKFHSERNDGDRFTSTNGTMDLNKRISSVERSVHLEIRWSESKSVTARLMEPIEVRGVKIHLDRLDMAVDGAYWVPFQKQANGSVWLAYYGTFPDGSRFWGEIEGDAKCSGLGFCSSRGFRERIERLLLETIREDLAKDIESKLKK